MSSISLNGPRKIYPKADGERLNFCFKNNTGQEIYDLWIVTGYDSTLGFTPEVKEIKITKGDEEVEFLDGLEPGDESDSVHVNFIDSIGEREEFCITIDFDEDFDDDEWVRFSPTNEDDATMITEESLSSSVQMSQVSLGTEKISRRRGVVRNSAEEKRIVARALYRMGPKLALGAIESIRRARK
ncbi:MAG: hypothetical protein NUV86_01880 [Candidatus Scalindua sp.]|nr:hypothetical protein [Candidatus Scalindua sp.]MCR4344237.1 hypothetical protein [Candidatus Scalindua sp.]